MITLLIADDHPIVREGIAALLSRQPDMRVVAECEDGPAALRQSLALRPDVLLLDLNMPGMGGVEVIEALRVAWPEVRAAVLTTFDGDEDVSRAMRAGAMGYLLKDAPRQQLLEAIRAVAAGRKWLSADAASRLAERMTLPELTPRELDVLRLMARGLSNKEIGGTLGIGEGTVKIHANSMFGKLGVQDRTQAVTLALRRGLVRL
jgi:two-component system, NarL family, response regulator